MAQDNKPDGAAFDPGFCPGAVFHHRAAAFQFHDALSLCSLFGEAGEDMCRVATYFIVLTL